MIATALLGVDCVVVVRGLTLWSGSKLPMMDANRSVANIPPKNAPFFWISGMITLEELGSVLRKRGYPATPKDLDVLSKELWGDTKKGKGISE